MTSRKDASLIYDGGRHALRQTRDGLLLYHTRDQFVGRSIAELGEFSKDESDFLKANLNIGDTVLEVGANLGALTVGLARKVGRQGRVHAFEPQRAVFALLCANAALNDLDQIRPWNLAVDAAPGSLTVPPTDYDGSANFGGIAMVRGTAAGDRVDAVSLDQHLADEPWTPGGLRLIKVDVEGMEFDVLQGARRLIGEFQPLIYAENDRKENSPALIGWLFEAGYHVYWHLVPYFTTDNFYQCDRDPFLETHGTRLLSVNIIGVPRHGEIAGAERLRIRTVTDWWKDLATAAD